MHLGRDNRMIARSLRALATGPQGTAGVLVAVTAMSVVTTSPVFFAGAFGAQISADLQIGPAALGGLAAVFFATTGLSATHLGRLADRLRGRTAGRWAILASVTSLGLAGFSGSYVVLLASMAIGGLGNGLGGPAANMIVADRIPKSAMGAAFGIKQSAVPAATLLGGLAIPLFVTGFGWRPTIVGAAVTSCLVSVFVPDATAMRQARGGKPGLDRTTLAVGVAFLFGIAAATSMSTLLTTFAVGAGLTSSSAGLILSAGSIGAIVVRILSGRAADRETLDPAKTAMWMMLTGVLGYGLISTQGAAGIAWGAFIAYAIGWGWSGLLVLNLVRAHTNAPGSATGVVLTGAAIGGMVGPASIGLIAEHIGFTPAWLVTGCLSLVAATAARLSGIYLEASLQTGHDRS